jgi:hypothetical protein
MKLNGWQRLWVFVSVPFVLAGIGSIIAGLTVFEEGLSAHDLLLGIWIAFGWPLSLYAIGWGIAWIRRGFREQSR